MTETLPAVTDDKRQGALLKAIGLDKVPPEQRELALAIAKRYELDLLLKHLVLIDGRPYITRDGLLWVAHRSGQLDGIEVTDPEVVTMPGVGEFWQARCSVYRKDMSRPFTYAGRYPTKGGNQKFAPEMAVKVSEVMALRRAFNVSAPVLEERWDMDPSNVIEQAPPAPLQDVVTAKRAAIEGRTIEVDSEPATVALPDEPGVRADTQATGSTDSGQPMPGSHCGHMPDPNPLGIEQSCSRPLGHKGGHGSPDGTWPA